MTKIAFKDKWPNVKIYTENRVERTTESPRGPVVRLKFAEVEVPAFDSYTDDK